MKIYYGEHIKQDRHHSVYHGTGLILMDTSRMLTQASLPDYVQTL